VQLTFQAIDEPSPGDKWASLFAQFWPAYHRWWLSQGESMRPTYLESRKALRRHMPELMPLYDRLVELAGGSDHAARFLTCYSPPPYLAGCSQAVWPGPEPLLVRNYDYSPQAFEGVVLRSQWLGRKVLGLSDCLVGLLDGVNEDGLAVSLTFGGRRTVGSGFGIPVVLRYVLETCASVDEAIRALKRIPCHMAYNVTVLDRDRNFRTVFLRPDRRALVTDAPAATNHQQQVEWQEHARATSSVEREAFLLQRGSSRPFSARRCTRRASSTASARCTQQLTCPRPVRWSCTGPASAGSSRWTTSRKAHATSSIARAGRAEARHRLRLPRSILPADTVVGPSARATCQPSPALRWDESLRGGKYHHAATTSKPNTV
jgi:predicted choloylglycine hydrolase